MRFRERERDIRRRPRISPCMRSYTDSSAKKCKKQGDKYEEYLGVRPENPAQGVLQDIHWSQGSFGYFPSYALGSAFGAQLYYHMKQEMDFEGLLEQGKVDVIREYLRENIHQYGKLKDSRTILKDVTGEDFDPKYYVRYLKEKYGKLYEVEA